MFSNLIVGKSGTSCATKRFNTTFERSDQWLSGARSTMRRSTFTLCHALLKKAILHHTEGLVKTELATTCTVLSAHVACWWDIIRLQIPSL